MDCVFSSNSILKMSGRFKKGRLITLTNHNPKNATNQSELEANTCNRCQARENACKVTKQPTIGLVLLLKYNKTHRNTAQVGYTTQHSTNTTAQHSKAQQIKANHSKAQQHNGHNATQHNATEHNTPHHNIILL